MKITDITDYKDELFDVEQSAKNQREVVKNGSPEFAPTDGVCWYCRKNIYQPIFKVFSNGRHEIVAKENAELVTGVTIEESKYCVTGCPHCNRSYCS